MPISSTAKAVGFAIAAIGTSDPKLLMEATGFPKSTLYRALAEYHEHCGYIPTSPTSGNPTCPTHGKTTEKSVPLVPPVGISERENPRAPARIETPSGLLSTKIGSEESEVGNIPISGAKPKATPRGARLQPDWVLPDDWRDWTRINFAHSTPESIQLEADKFRDYWVSKTGQQAAKLDWQATWRNWCRTAFAARPATLQRRPPWETAPDTPSPTMLALRRMAERAAAETVQ